MGRPNSHKKVDSPNTTSGGGAYNNYYKADQIAKGNPNAFTKAAGAVSSSLKAKGLPEEWSKPLLELMSRESSLNPSAANPKSSAKGYFQFLDSTRKNYGGDKVNWNDPNVQINAGLQYIIDRYGTPEDALAFWDSKGYY